MPNLVDIAALLQQQIDLLTSIDERLARLEARDQQD